MKQFLQIVALLAVLLGFGVQESTGGETSTLSEELDKRYGESFDVGDFRFYRSHYNIENNVLEVAVGATDDFKANGVRAVLPTQVEYDGKTWTVTGTAYAGFRYCNELEEVIFPNVPYGAKLSDFYHCKKLGPSITFPGEMGSYYESLYPYGQPNLTEICFGKSDREVDIDGPKYESGSIQFLSIVTGRDIRFYLDKIPLQSVRFDSTVCLKGMENLTILDGTDVTKLFNFTEWHLVNLTMGKDITGLPASMASHTKLQSITLTTETPPECPIFTYDQYKNIILTVPQNALDTYRKTKRWKNFRTINVSGIDAPAVEPSERTLTGRYDLHGRPVADDYRGLVIERYSDGTAAKKIIGR